MNIHKSKVGDVTTATVTKTPSSQQGAAGGGVFLLQCFDSNNNLKWEREAKNRVVNVGLQSMVNVYLDASTQITTWYIGLIEGPGAGVTVAAGDTLATHGGWTELTAGTAYTGNRKTATFGTATLADPSVINNSASPADFAMLGSYTVGGALLCDASTGTSGLLFSASTFTGGDATVTNGDTIRVTYTFSLDAV